MRNLLFKHWMLSEMADYGKDNEKYANKPMGGTEKIPGEELYQVMDPSIIIEELAKMPPIGTNYPSQKWDSVVEWGIGEGAIQLEYTPLGAVRMITRRKIMDLQGQPAWICKHVEPIHDVGDYSTEYGLAVGFHEQAEKIAMQMVEGPANEFNELERLAWKLWAGVKREHPSYAMFPVGLRKQDENYYKLVFEFRGGGQGDITNGGFLRRFDIDLTWDQKRGLLRCFGYNIDSPQKRSSWNLNPSEWDEIFSPAQNHQEIIECIITTFMQY